MRNISINIGGDGEPTEIPLTIKGCDCRAEDFVLALVKFANEWKAKADKATVNPVSGNSDKPCGCKDAK